MLMLHLARIILKANNKLQTAPAQLQMAALVPGVKYLVLVAKKEHLSIEKFSIWDQ